MKKPILAVLACLFCNSFFAQQVSPQVINSSGTTFSATSALLSFNVGEPAITTIGNGSNRISQGFLQPPSSVTGIHENSVLHAFDVFPNPVSSELNIRSATYKNSVWVKLIDAMGRNLYSGELKGNTLGLEQLPEGIYQLLLFNSEQKIIDRKTITKIN